MRSLARSALTSLAYAGVTVAALIQLVLTVVVFVPGFGLGMVFLLPISISYFRRYTNTWRRVVGRLSNVDIAVPYNPPPPPPQPEADGYYRHDRSLHKSPRMPAFFNRLDWVLKDRGTGFDFLWLLSAPVAGVLFGLLPLGLVAAGLAGAPWGLLLIPVAIAITPVTNFLFARWTRFFLQPPTSARHTFMVSVWATVILVLSAAVELVLGLGAVLGLVLGFGIGLIPVIPLALWSFRWLANLRRRAVKQWIGIDVPRPYRPLEEPELRPDGMFRSGRQLYKTRRWARAASIYNWIVKDVASWRDLAWLILDPFVTVALVGLPAFLFVYGIWGQALPSLTSLLGAPRLAWYGAVNGHWWLAVPVSLVMVLLAILISRPLLKVHAHWTRLLLAPTKAAELRGTVARLTETRTDAIDAQSAELRRIERDLHDGAQARLVAVGLTLGTIERLLDTDPDAARKLLAQARETSAQRPGRAAGPGPRHPCRRCWPSAVWVTPSGRWRWTARCRSRWTCELAGRFAGPGRVGRLLRDLRGADQRGQARRRAATSPSPCVPRRRAADRRSPTTARRRPTPRGTGLRGIDGGWVPSTAR